MPDKKPFEEWFATQCDDGAWMVHTVGDVIAVDGFNLTEERAKQIAADHNAFPDILMALQNLMAMVDSGIIKGDGKHDIETQARTAIAKAEGR